MQGCCSTAELQASTLHQPTHLSSAIIFWQLSPCESVLQEAKQLLEQGQQHRLDVKETLLQTIAMLGQHTRSPSAQLLVLAVLVGRLDDLDPGIRSFAAQLLLGELALCSCSRRSFCSVKFRAIDAMVTAEKDGVNSFSLIWITPTYDTVGTLAAKIGPRTGS